MGLFDSLFGIDKLIEAKVAERTEELGKTVITHIDNSMSKATTPSSPAIPSMGTVRYQLDPQLQNKSIYSKNKPDSSIPFDVLRKFSIQHEISRAAINYRKRQISRLPWDIVSADKSAEKIDDKAADEVRLFFKNLGGTSTRYRKFIGKATEDLLVLDAVSLLRWQTKGASLYSLLPVDPATIRLVVDASGGTPVPPHIAYKQVIRGTVVNEYTTDEMIYDMINPRTNTPYGLAPLESLMIVVTSSLKAALANQAFLTEGNIPEGFFGVPKEWTPQMIADFQNNWDAVMAGDEAATAKLKFTPEGSYQPAKKMTDMGWEQFNEWLMKVTCAMFDVDPSEIGFKPQSGLGGKGMAEQANQTSDERGLETIANFFEEIFTSVIQNELGHPDLAFHYTGLDQDADAKIEAEVNEIKIRSGQRTINEIRTDEGLEADPSPLANKLMIVSGTPTFLETEEELAEKKRVAESIGGTPDERKPAPKETEEEEKPDDTQKMVALVGEFRKFRKMAVARKKAGKSFRAFQSDILPEAIIVELNRRVEKAQDVKEVQGIVGEYMQDYQIDFLTDVIDLNQNLKKVLR